VIDIADFSGGDDTLTSAPGHTGSDIDITEKGKLTCAGEFGCHGTHNVGENSDAGINGFHHRGAGKEGYRFLQLKEGVATPVAIPGKGSPTWEYNGGFGPDQDDHNVYSEGTESHDDAGISRYCATCHTEFHGTNTQDVALSWIRHPTEELIPDTWAYNITNSYSQHPVAFTDADILANSIEPDTAYGWGGGEVDVMGKARVMCLSCHHAHGSAYDDLLRFPYEPDNDAGIVQQAGTTMDYGCLGCHSAQRGADSPTP
jgi:hypothetical protein